MEKTWIAKKKCQQRLKKKDFFESIRVDHLSMFVLKSFVGEVDDAQLTVLTQTHFRSISHLLAKERISQNNSQHQHGDGYERIPAPYKIYLFAALKNICLNGWDKKYGLPIGQKGISIKFKGINFYNKRESSKYIAK